LQHVSSGLLILFLYLRSGLSSSQASFCLLFSAAGLFAIHLLRSRVPAVQRVYLTLFRPLMRLHELHGPPGALFFLLGCGVTIELFGSDSVTARSLGLSPVSVACASAEGANPWSITAATGGLADIPALAILCLSVGDPLASLVGQMLGARDRWRLSLAAGGDKSLIAAAISAAVCAIASHSLLHLMLHAATASTGAAAASSFLPTACSAPGLQSWSGSDCGAQLAASERGVWCWSLFAGLAASVFELWPLGFFLPGAAAAPVDDNLRIPVLTGLLLWAARAVGVLPSTLLVEAHCRGSGIV
jgi:dolichol kinase